VTTGDRPRAWAAIVARHARAAGADLPAATIDELSAHLDDLYTDAIRRGASEEAAYRTAIDALSTSPLANLTV